MYTRGYALIKIILIEITYLLELFVSYLISCYLAFVVVLCSALECMADGSIAQGLRSILGSDILGQAAAASADTETESASSSVGLGLPAADARDREESQTENVDGDKPEGSTTPGEIAATESADSHGALSSEKIEDGNQDGNMDDDNMDGDNDGQGEFIEEETKDAHAQLASVEEGEEEEEIFMEDGEEAS